MPHSPQRPILEPAREDPPQGAHRLARFAADRAGVKQEAQALERGALEPVVDLAGEAGLAVVLLAEGGDEAEDRVRGEGVTGQEEGQEGGGVWGGCEGGWDGVMNRSTRARVECDMF